MSRKNINANPCRKPGARADKAAEHSQPRTWINDASALLRASHAKSDEQQREAGIRLAASRLPAVVRHDPQGALPYVEQKESAQHA
jgi:hypothetical protein